METVVLGNDTMGTGIVQTMTQKGLAVTMKGRNSELLDHAVQRMNKRLNRLVEKGKMVADDLKQIIGRITITAGYANIAWTDLVIEVTSGEMEAKKEILREIDGLAQPSAIFATNTSSLGITELVSAIKRPEQVIGMHSFNPVLVMELVEVTNGQYTSEQTLQMILTLCEQPGKTAARMSKAPSFVVNRILIPMINEATGECADGVATAEEIDAVTRLGASHPMEPLALDDFIGLDVCLAIMEVLNNEYIDPRYRPHLLLRKMVCAGQFSRKNSKGSYDYSKKQSLPPRGRLYHIKPKAKHNG